MNILDRWTVKALWKGAKLKFPQIKRWAPLIGTLIVAASAVARAFGREEIAQLLDTIGALTGLSGEALLGAAAAASLGGIALKVTSEIKKARQAQ